MSVMGWPEPGTEFRIKSPPIKRSSVTYGDYVKLVGNDLTWPRIQAEYDRVYEQAVDFLRTQGFDRYVNGIKMIVKIETEKSAMLGDLVSGDAPYMTIGWKCEVAE